ncbi:hypothetical protein LTR53_009695 [Teratosphaeriaceae sp. CCFEE 6253]|nr:hypothetical protein LTR53_009695 [Teratosphaeriaceae sp. CCFEE 6253]
MAVSTRSDFIDFIVPLYERLELYDRTRPPGDQPRNDAADPARNLPDGFIDAMKVREQVFVKEQGIPLEDELDKDDKHSYHWVVYASVPARKDSSATPAEGGHAEPPRRVSTSTKVPIGTIRLVPGTQDPYPKPSRFEEVDAAEVETRKSKREGKEAYVKIGRLAVVKEYRKAGISKLLIDTVLAFARENPSSLMPTFDPAMVEALRQLSNLGTSFDWKGLLLVHSQIGVQKVWRRYGFETDHSMGVWDEEGIEHVGMWKRLDMSGRRKSKAWQGSLSSPLGSP